MKNLKLILLSCIIALGIAAPAFAQQNDVYGCVTDFVTEEKPKRDGVRSAVFQPSKQWIPGQKLRVKFLDGSEFVKNKVKLYAEVWEQYANIDFVFVESGPAEIRVRFAEKGSSWSYFGKDSAIQSSVKRGDTYVIVPGDTTGASMNFGWFDEKTPEQEFRRTTLHEFGHALGLKHEHQNANGKIQWNEEAVYAYFAKQGWSKEKTYYQVLKRYGDDSEITNSAYDPLSIMHYSYPPELIKGDLKTYHNKDLSEGDKAIIAEMYPFDETVTVNKPTTNKPTTDKPTTNKPVSPTNVQSNLPTFAFTDVSVDYEGYDDQTEQDGMVFTSDFTVKNALKQELTMAIYFFAADGTPLVDSNKQFFSAGGKVAVYKKFIPAYADAVYKQFEVFMPYEELELDCGKHNLKYTFGIWNGPKQIFSTGATYFVLNVPCE